MGCAVMRRVLLRTSLISIKQAFKTADVRLSKIARLIGVRVCFRYGVFYLVARYRFSAMTMKAVGTAAMEMVQEVEIQFDEVRT